MRGVAWLKTRAPLSGSFSAKSGEAGAVDEQLFAEVVIIEVLGSMTYC